MAILLLRILLSGGNEQYIVTLALLKHVLCDGINYLGRNEGKGKSVPLQAWSGPEGSRKLRFPEFMTTAQWCGKVVSLTHRPPLSQEILLVLISV